MRAKRKWFSIYKDGLRRISYTECYEAIWPFIFYREEWPSHKWELRIEYM